MTLTADEARILEEVDGYVRKNNVGHTLRGPIRDKHGEPEGVVSNPDHLVGLHASTHILVKDMADLLIKNYPGFRWAIQPNEAGGVFNVFNLDFNAVWGYVIRYDDVMNDPRRREAVRAGREILRRFRYPHHRFDRDLMAKVVRDPSGNAIPDVSGLKANRFTKQAELRYKLETGQARVIARKGQGHIIEVRE